MKTSFFAARRIGLYAASFYFMPATTVHGGYSGKQNIVYFPVTSQAAKQAIRAPNIIDDCIRLHHWKWS